MGNRARNRMNRKERAKQFVPFDALTGFREALREREKIRAERRELPEEWETELSRRIGQIQKNDCITVEFYEAGEYLIFTGMVSKVDKRSKKLVIVKREIRFGDIVDIQREGEVYFE